MSPQLHRKNKIILSDYPYQRDVEIRLLLARLTVFEVSVLQEILNNSLTIPLEHLVENLQVDLDQITPVIDKFTPSKLLKLEGKKVVVDKEMRKFFETQIIKFEEDFEPGVDFLQGLLAKVPMHILLQWYGLPRTSDHLFQAILEKFIGAPRLYERYLAELDLEDDLLKKISADVFNSPDLMVKGAELIKKYRLTHSQFEELMLHLEFNLVCVLSYQKIGKKWEEIVTPFYEWREYLLHLRSSAPKPITTPATVAFTRPENFAFVVDMQAVLEATLKKPILLEKKGDAFVLPEKIRETLMPEVSSAYCSKVIDRILFMHFGKVEDKLLSAQESAKNWLKKTPEQRAFTMSRHPIAVEKGLTRFINTGWNYVDDFVQGFSGILCGKEKIILKNKGKKWRYALPEYSPEERLVIKTTLWDRLFEAGIVNTGLHKGKECFCVTPYGKHILED